jgi:hypothetical protein
MFYSQGIRSNCFRLSGPFRKAKPSLSRRKIDEHEHAIERFKKRQDYSYIRFGIMLDVLSTLAELNLMCSGNR